MAAPLANRRTAESFVDARPVAAAQRRMRALMDSSPQANRLNTIQAMMAGSAQARRLSTIQAMLAAAPRQRAGIAAESGVVQMAVSHSGTYSAVSTGRTAPQTLAINTALNTLDGLVPTAEANATIGVALAPAARTPTQNAYANLPNAARWGSCVEEQLNALDGAWGHQHQLPGSRRRTTI